MKKNIIITLFAALSLFGFSNTSNAQTKSFDGPYVGISIGKTYGNIKHSGTYYSNSVGDDDVVGETKDLNDTNVSLRAGYVSRISGSNTVLGLELTRSNLDASIESQADIYENAGSGDGITSTVKFKDYTTLAIRLGQVLNDKTLISVSAGPALAKISESHYRNNSWGGGDESLGPISTNKTGYVLGFGGEYKLTPQVSIRADYEYLNFGKVNITSFNGASGGLLNDTNKVNFGNVSVGLVYSF